MLKFDKEKHDYQFNGKSVLSVTKVLPDIPDFLLCKQSFIEKTLLGSRVHDCCDTINQHYMTHFQIPDDMHYLNNRNKKEDVPYINAYIKFLQDHKPTLYFSEKKEFHSLYNYAGTIDSGMLFKKKDFIVDLKTSTSIAPYAKLQLAAYTKAYNNNNKKQIFNRMIVQLLPTGDYFLKAYPVAELTADFNWFLCKLKSAQWDMENMKGYAF